MSTTALEQVIDFIDWNLAPPVREENPQTQIPNPESRIPAITTPDQLKTFIWETFQIRISDHRCCPDKGHRSPWEAFCYAYFATGPVCIWKASRGFGGKSFMLSLLSVVEAITLRADVKILGGSGEQSKRVLEYTEHLWELPSAPKDLLAGEPGARQTVLTTGNKIEALMASTRSARGPHPQRLRLDEIDEMALKVLNAASGQTMSKGWVKSQTVMSSTHHYPKGTFTQKLQEAAEKGWPVFEWCYRANLASVGGFIEDDEIARKRIEVPTAMWSVEYEGQEPTAEGRAFDTDAVKWMFQESFGFEDDPVEGAAYATGADWARKVNHTVISTLRRDLKPMRLAQLVRVQEQPWPVMIGIYNDTVKKYRSTRRHDATGLGDVIDGYVTKQSEEDGIIMVGRDRADLLSEYVNAVERHELQVPWPDPSDESERARAVRVMKKEHEYASVDDLYGHDRGKLPDTVSSMAMVYRAAKVPTAAGEMVEPDVPNSPLHGGLERGRLSNYIGIGRRGRT